MVRALHLKNGLLWTGDNFIRRDLYTTEVIVDQPASDALTIDLDGWAIFPGLINAHDHLELNHYPRSKFRDVYDNAHQWGEEMNARLDAEPYQSLRAYPLKDRLFIGGLKNLLSGATTVAHHNPPHKALFRRGFPVRVLKKYGWTHSLHFSSKEEVIRSYHSTPKAWPWFIHLAEGTDEVAGAEYRQLKALGCVGSNTVIVHGVGLIEEDLHDARKTIRGLIWCPSTNQHLLNQTLGAKALAAKSDLQLALGSDSRLTADGDLLDELRSAFETFGDSRLLLRYVTQQAADLVDCPRGGRLMAGGYADFIALSESENVALSLCHLHRASLALVVKGGIPQIGDPGVMAQFPHVQTVRARLDGVEKAIHIDLAYRIIKCSIQEPGLEVDAPPSKKRFWIFNRAWCISG